MKDPDLYCVLPNRCGLQPEYWCFPACVQNVPLSWWLQYRFVTLFHFSEEFIWFVIQFMSNSFALAPSWTATGLACVRNYIKTTVPVKLPIGAHTCYGKNELGFNCTSRCCGQWRLCLLRWWFFLLGHFSALTENKFSVCMTEYVSTFKCKNKKY